MGRHGFYYRQSITILSYCFYYYYINSNILLLLLGYLFTITGSLLLSLNVN